MDRRLEREPALSQFFQDFAVSFVEVGWSLPEVDAAVRFMRDRVERGRSLPEALMEVFELQRIGRLVAEDPEC